MALDFKNAAAFFVVVMNDVVVLAASFQAWRARPWSIGTSFCFVCMFWFRRKHSAVGNIPFVILHLFYQRHVNFGYGSLQFIFRFMFMLITYEICIPFVGCTVGSCHVWPLVAYLPPWIFPSQKTDAPLTTPLQSIMCYQSPVAV